MRKNAKNARSESGAPGPRSYRAFGIWSFSCPAALLAFPRRMTPSNVASEAPRRRSLRFQESGLVIVIVLLGALLVIFGGKVKMPLFETNAQGERQRVF